jgi:hypothetical protein
VTDPFVRMWEVDSSSLGSGNGRESFPTETAQPRPMNGIRVAISVMNWTFASSGSVAM